MSKIYLATPYSSPDAEIMRFRYFVVTTAAAQLMKEGHIVYSPITHCRPIAVITDLPHDWNFWQKMNTEFIKWADKLVYLDANGWEESTGLGEEFELAHELNKPIELFPPLRRERIEQEISIGRYRAYS